jgi:hypothetical protein
MNASWRFCASACFSAALLAGACDQASRSAATGAQRDASSENGVIPAAAANDDVRSATAAVAPDPASAATVERTPTAVVESPPAAGATPVAEVTPDPYLVGRPLSAKSIGHTSYVLKLRLENGLTVAYKPRSKLPLGDRRYRGEIAAYRLGRALGLNNVPCAMPRTFAAGELRAAFATQEGAQEFDQKALLEPTGRVRGALIPWIERYEELSLEKRAARLRWEPWLTDPGAQIPQDERALARALSTMLAFDYVTANWDRWSGGNVVRDGATGTLLFVDNDGAFYELPPQSLARQEDLLRRVLRFSRSFVTALRALDVSELRDVFGEEERAARLLPERTIEQVDTRRQAVLGFVDAAIARWGEPTTLAFE